MELKIISRLPFHMKHPIKISTGTITTDASVAFHMKHESRGIMFRVIIGTTIQFHMKLKIVFIMRHFITRPMHEAQVRSMG